MAPEAQHLILTPPQEQRQLPGGFQTCLQARGSVGPAHSIRTLLPACNYWSQLEGSNPLSLAQATLDKHSNDPLQLHGHPEPCKTAGALAQPTAQSTTAGVQKGLPGT